MSNNCYIPGGMEDDDFDDPEYDPVLKTTQNMKIIVVADITQNAGLNGENFDAKLSPDNEKWFKEYKTMWNIYKKTPCMMQSLQTLFLTHENPLLLALKLFANCPGCDNIKTKNLAYFVLETICNLRKEKLYISQNCTNNTKMVAFNFVKTQGSPQIYKAVTDTYDLKSSKDIFRPKISELIKSHYYKDASYWATYLDLTTNYSIYEIPLPLILQDKISIAEEFLDGAISLRAPLIELLDKLLADNASIITSCDELIIQYNYKDVKREKLYHKPLAKLVLRLAKKYNIPNESIPNVSYAKSYGYLQYLVHKKYVEKCMSNEAWRELIREFVLSSKLQNELIELICSHCDYEEAYYWTKFFKIPEMNWQAQVTEFAATHCQNLDVIEESWNGDTNDKITVVSCCATSCQQPCYCTHKTVKFYEIDLTNICVILISSQEKFCNMLKTLGKEKIIGFDSEWKPSFQGEALVNLMQLAIPSKIYLIDVLSKEISGPMWKQLSLTVFNNNDMLKVGFSLQHDLIMFHKALPILNINLSDQTGYFDLQDAWKKLKNMKNFVFPYRSASCTENLCTLVELCFGKKLDKSNQFSNWANRPLRKEQMIYAALDAYCLLEIYDVIMKQLSQIRVDMNDFVESVISETKNKTQKIKHHSESKSAKKGEIIESPFNKYQKVVEVKFVCDEMLGGLTKTLRKIGIDCLIVKKHTEDAVKIAMQDGRFLLTQGFCYVKLVQYLPHGHCYEVKSDQIEEQAIEVLKFFNIIIYKKNIFSRCQICNCNEFILATKYDMRILKFGDQNKICITEKKIDKGPPKRSFILKKITPKILQSKNTDLCHPIQYTKIPDYIIDTFKFFYICQGCGKCYWDGSHLGKFMNGYLKDFVAK